MQLFDKIRKMNPKKKRKIIMWAIIVIIAVFMIAYCVCNPEEISSMTGGELDGVVS
ncbi:MAG: hypothetical protein U0L36_00805 [Acutalibacteraceae bacterium]|nr:hypothetical protein [Acutalibacteraceae bacterium]MEE1074537.1 hypothetical protein [Acutalibacteraceae bacterium]